MIRGVDAKIDDENALCGPLVARASKDLFFFSRKINDWS
jgi:hypothetical protein